jgi:hypothetical protein
MAYLGDDGTLDTVIVCDTCGTEHRFTFDPVDDDERSNGPDPGAYDAFVAECIEQVDDDCQTCMDDEAGMRDHPGGQDA